MDLLPRCTLFAYSTTGELLACEIFVLRRRLLTRRPPRCASDLISRISISISR